MQPLVHWPMCCGDFFLKLNFDAFDTRWSGLAKKFRSQKPAVSTASKLPWKTYILKCIVSSLTLTLKIPRKGEYLGSMPTVLGLTNRLLEVANSDG